ncbi:MAG TPA: class I SAM-dependent methyltransferase [Phycisphaerae bacterium]|nr:class I SAM-dependent methyltransferase [Phycisphaerae bacterium]
MHSIQTPLRMALARQLHGRILDCGSGDGLFSSFLRREGNEVISLDVDVEALRKQSGHCVAASCERIPFPDDTFDSVWACAVIEHVAEDTLPEMIRVTRPGGQIIAVTPNRYSPFDPLLRLVGLKPLGRRPGHVRLYSVKELRGYGKVHGETRFLPFLRWFSWHLPHLAHVIIVDIRVTRELKEKFVPSRKASCGRPIHASSPMPGLPTADAAGLNR